MKYVFFGTPRFAEIILGELIRADMQPMAIVCNPDRPVGRKKIITPPPTKMLVEQENARGANIAIFQPEKIDANLIEQLRKLEPDFFVIAAYSKILPASILKIPRLGTLGVHPSLLPKYRGASPIQSAILHGETESGVTIYLVDEKTDHGPMLGVRSTELTENETYITLEEKLARIGADILINLIPDFLARKIMPKIQDESQATLTKKFKTEDGFVSEADLEFARHPQTDSSTHDSSQMAKQISQKINALNPEPGAWTTMNGKRVKLLAGELRDGALQLSIIQEEGQKPRNI
jgi:methionyl-tRNA formyltransferase